jgi:RNA polymerase sigma-70 factor (ECF subfamily)
MRQETLTADLELAARLRAGDMQAFEEVFRQHGTRLYNVALRMLGQPADAEDALQEVFLQAFRKIGGFKGESSLGTWLYRLAINLCLDRLRSRTTSQDRRTDRLDATDDLPSLAGADAAAIVVNRMDLERAIAGLPDGYRAAFVLHDVEGFEHREVGAILGISEGTSRSQVHKARLRLRHLLAPPHRAAS